MWLVRRAQIYMEHQRLVFSWCFLLERSTGEAQPESAKGSEWPGTLGTHFHTTRVRSVFSANSLQATPAPRWPRRRYFHAPIP